MTDPKPTPVAVPQDAAPTPDTAVEAPQPATPDRNPTRYGDWELNGKCVDF